MSFLPSLLTQTDKNLLTVYLLPLQYIGISILILKVTFRQEILRFIITVISEIRIQCGKCEWISFKLHILPIFESNKMIV